MTNQRTDHRYPDDQPKNGTTKHRRQPRGRIIETPLTNRRMEHRDPDDEPTGPMDTETPMTERRSYIPNTQLGTEKGHIPISRCRGLTLRNDSRTPDSRRATEKYPQRLADRVQPGSVPGSFVSHNKGTSPLRDSTSSAVEAVLS